MQNLETYKFKTTPDPHQLEILQNTAHLNAFALFWEMGVAKTKPTIDNIAILFEQNQINGALILAPNGVDLNWLNDEIPKHLPDHIRKESRIFRFSSKKSKSKWHKEEIRWLLQHSPHSLAILIMSYDAIMTLEGKEAALNFLDKRTTFYVLDESVAIKTPGAKRTMRIVRTAHRAKYRRILDGLPTPKGAFDIYSQIQFLDADFWKRQGWDNFAMFKSHFGVFEQAWGKGSQEYERLLGFRNLAELSNLIAPISSRLLKSQVLNLPPKVYLPRYFELAPIQRKMYDELENEFRLWLDADTLVTANLAIVRLLRLQQISCGYIPTPPTDDAQSNPEPMHMIEGPNPRLKMMEEILETNEDKAIIWARYKLDISLLQQLLTKHKKSFVTYTGDTNDEDREYAREAFQNNPDIQYFLGTPSAAGKGLTLHAAHHSIYYSNSFNLSHRKQSEDRVHRRGLEHSATYIDLLGNDTVDKRIMLNLCEKMNTSDAILGDAPGLDLRSQLSQWLNHE